MTNNFLPGDIEEIGKRLSNESDLLSGKTLLMSGGRGFLGRYFTDVLEWMNKNSLEKPCRLIILDNLITAGAEGAKLPDLTDGEFHEHDIIEPFDPGEPIDLIMHLAGIASPYYYRAYPLETLEVAITGTRNLLELAEKSDARFTFFSSSEIYGDPAPNQIPTQESYRGNVSCQGPRACYDESKRVGETLCYIYHTKYGTHTNVIRPFNVYGPGMQETDYRVLPNFASKIKAGQPVSVYGSGNQTRTFCYITDAITGFMKVALKGVAGEAYNIGNPDPEISMMDLVRQIEEVTGKKVGQKIIDYPDSYPADEPNRRCPDIRKARLQLDYTPAVSLNDGLGRFFGWADKTYTGVQ